MNPTIENAAAAYMAPKVLRGFRVSWVLYGVAAYYGLKYLNKRGILPSQTNAALNFIDRGIELAKNQLGFGGGISHQRSANPSQASLPH